MAVRKYKKQLASLFSAVDIVPFPLRQCFLAVTGFKQDREMESTRQLKFLSICLCLAILV
jgi:hypothetical protein